MDASAILITVPSLTRGDLKELRKIIKKNQVEAAAFFDIHRITWAKWEGRNGSGPGKPYCRLLLNWAEGQGGWPQEWARDIWKRSRMQMVERIKKEGIAVEA